MRIPNLELKCAQRMKKVQRAHKSDSRDRKRPETAHDTNCVLKIQPKVFEAFTERGAAEKPKSRMLEDLVHIWILPISVTFYMFIFQGRKKN